jgi:hypothetical protein
MVSKVLFGSKVSMLRTRWRWSKTPLIPAGVAAPRLAKLEYRVEKGALVHAKAHRHPLRARQAPLRLAAGVKVMPGKARPGHTLRARPCCVLPWGRRV